MESLNARTAIRSQSYQSRLTICLRKPARPSDVVDSQGGAPGYAESSEVAAKAAARSAPGRLFGAVRACSRRFAMLAYGWRHGSICPPHRNPPLQFSPPQAQEAGHLCDHTRSSRLVSDCAVAQGQ
jgi:hypothetical protein